MWLFDIWQLYKSDVFITALVNSGLRRTCYVIHKSIFSTEK